MDSSDAIAIQEQVIEDHPSGLTFTIWRTPDGEGRIRVSGDLPLGNRDFQFDKRGRLVGTGTSVGGSCPSHLRLV
jgi:hypothetical protein